MELLFAHCTNRRTSGTLQRFHPQLDENRTTHHRHFLHIRTIKESHRNGPCVARDFTKRWHSDHQAFIMNLLMLLMLRLLSSKAQGRKYFRKPSKPCHVAIHWKALAEYFHMSTHLPGFRSFFRFFASFCIGQISHQQHKGYDTTHGQHIGAT